ncbi:MAG TPA: tRNA lysidine(34) synthetase TilS [bacterium]|nr:tRNA lysidine(34) synthetase TilS [bacterium]
MDSFVRLLDTCARSLSRYENVAAEGPVMAAVSGGPDSTLLLLALARLRDEGRLGRPLCVAHVDHAVRADSRANARFVVDLCDRLDVPVTVRRLAFDGVRQSEDTLRNARYRALEECARHFSAQVVMTAHHADDNLETVLFRMLRGTDPRGLAGIPESRWLGRGDRRLLLVRPMLRVRRTTIEALLTRLGERSYHDHSNDDLRFARNRLRHETIPALRRAMGIGLDISVMTVVSTARAANEIIEAQGLRILTQRARHKTAWRLELDLHDLDGDSLPFVREALRQAHVTLHPFGDAPSSAWLDRCIALLDKHDGKRVAGRGGLLVERTRRGLLLVDTDRAGAPPRTHDGGQRLWFDHGRTRFGATEWSIEANTHPLPPLYPSPQEAGPLRALLDPRTCPGPWRLRTRRPGDRFQPLGFGESVDLRRFLQSRHVPRFDRDRLPLVVDADDRVLWICGVEVGESARLHLNTRQCVELRAFCG